MKKFVATLCTFALVFTIACGGGQEVADDEEEGEDEVEEVVATDTSGTGAPAAAAPAVSADAATITGLVKFEGAPKTVGNVAMSADPYCQSQHQTPVKGEDFVIGPAGELAN